MEVNNMSITLGQFLYQACQTLPIFTYLDTDNDTFPIDYRFKEIYLFTFVDKINTDLGKSILRMEIDNINNSPDLHLRIMYNKFNSDIRPVKLSISLCTLSNIN